MAKVLVVDDVPDNVKLLNYDLCDEGYTVVCASNGREAIELARTQQPDVILLDVAMPGMDGIEVCRRLKEDGITESIPVIMVSAMGQEDTVISALDTGALDYVSKPFSIQIVLARVRSAVRIKTSHDTIVRMNRRLAELNDQAHQFVDNVSHEFRTPLTVIKEFTSILADGLAGDLNQEQLDYLDIVANRIDDLCFMVNDMLDISKLEAGLLTVCRRECNLCDITEHVRSTLERKARGKNVSIAIDIPSDIPKIRCDAEKIGRVIINLVVNAVKFVDEGGKIELRAQAVEDSPHVTVSVIDDGPGIAEDNLKAIFERFRQVEGSARSSTKGFGLGLNIAKELVHMNLGQMNVESKVGEGSTFSLTIPVADPGRYMRHCLSQPMLFRDDTEFVCMTEAKVPEQTSPEMLHEVEEFMQHLTRQEDLLFSPGPARWFLVTLANRADTSQMMTRISKAWSEANRNRPTGPLPNLNLENRGSWRVGNEQEAFLEFFLAELRGGERDYAQTAQVSE